MLFHEKLDFLMKLTATKNNALGKALNFDPSYISRIRSGKRGLPKDLPFTEPAAVYFAKKIRKPFEQRAAADVILGASVWPENPEEAAGVLISWLAGPHGESFSAAAPEGTQEREVRFLPDGTQAGSPLQASFYYGNAGKREAVLRFLSAALASDAPVRLCLYSDEEMTWLYEDPAFIRRWGELLVSVCAAGGQIVIIHTLSRNIGEMLEAIRRWSPIYATGAVIPYYCPKVRDGIMQRSLFIARKVMALTAQSAGISPSHSLNLLTWEGEAVGALEEDFERLLQLCRPLMKIYGPADIRQFEKIVLQKFSTEGTLYLIREGTSPTFLPDSGSRLLQLIRTRLEAGDTVYDCMCLPSPSQGGKKEAESALSPSLPAGSSAIGSERKTSPSDPAGTAAAPVPEEVWRSPAQKAAPEGGFDDMDIPDAGILAEMLELLLAFPNYRLYLFPGKTVFPLDVIARVSRDSFEEEPVSILMQGQRSHKTGFLFTEQRLSVSFIEYLERILSENPGREETERLLQRYLSGERT